MQTPSRRSNNERTQLRTVTARLQSKLCMHPFPEVAIVNRQKLMTVMSRLKTKIFAESLRDSNSERKEIRIVIENQ